jgi:glucose 1-dehydrogenase
MADDRTKRLAGQRAIVTGGGSGIGAAIAKALAAAGARVAVNHPGVSAGADSVVEAITEAGGEAIAVQADITREEDVERMFRDVVAAWGSIDILVNNAGIQDDAPLVDMAVAQWDAVMNVNLRGQFLCSRAAAREFLRRGPLPGLSSALGKILCISSVHDVIPWAGHANYVASKGGVMLFMKSIAQELAEHHVRVNAISPGAIKTDLNREARETPEAEAAMLTLIPYGRIGDVEDVANAAVWLVSDDSDYVTGATLYVDGGMLLYPAFREGG